METLNICGDYSNAYDLWRGSKSLCGYEVFALDRSVADYDVIVKRVVLKCVFLLLSHHVVLDDDDVSRIQGVSHHERQHAARLRAGLNKTSSKEEKNNWFCLHFTNVFSN